MINEVSDQFSQTDLGQFVGSIHLGLVSGLFCPHIKLSNSVYYHTDE